MRGGTVYAEKFSGSRTNNVIERLYYWSDFSIEGVLIAYGTNKADSDFDFYVIVADDEQNFLELTQKAYRAMRGKKDRSVDIVVVRQSKFEERKNWELSLEREVDDKGVLLYAA